MLEDLEEKKEKEDKEKEEKLKKEHALKLEQEKEEKDKDYSPPFISLTTTITRFQSTSKDVMLEKGKSHPTPRVTGQIFHILVSSLSGKIMPIVILSFSQQMYVSMELT